jgi:hypothetical protein
LEKQNSDEVVGISILMEIRYLAGAVKAAPKEVGRQTPEFPGADEQVFVEAMTRFLNTGHPADAF